MGGSVWTQTLALISSGNTTVQDWNGTNWTSGVSNSYNRTNRFWKRLTTAAGMIAFGGEAPTSTVSEEWTAPATSTVTFTAS